MSKNQDAVAMSPRVLLLDPPTRISRELELALIEAGLDVVRHVAADDAILELGRGVDVALGERSLGADELLRAARGGAAAGERVPCILFDDFGTAEEAGAARDAGAFDVLARPLPHEVVLQAVRRALAETALRRENDHLRSAAARHETGELESADERMRRVFATVCAVADSDATILLAGESGVGKTRLARAIHRRSTRVERPFVEVNCGALPESLLESELFGHRKGAFTGAVADRRGKFEAAHTGTLFLDEIATASPALQVKLLRVLEDQSFEPVGGERTLRVDVRLIVATNRDLLAEVEAGRFREDLYYRIHVVAVEVPPLRDRPADLPVLAARFLRAFAARHRRPVTGIAPDALQALVRARWPGNVRELENAIERAVLLAHGPRIERDDLGLDLGSVPAAPAPPAPGSTWETLPLGPLKQALEIPERALILRALRHHHGSRTETAATLGINRTTLFNKMRKYDLLSFPAGGPSQADPAGELDAPAPEPGRGGSR
jgi:DNA-binding NtrC family response regulator